MLCNTCKKKLDQIKKTKQSSSLVLATFEAHSDTCCICFGKSKSSKTTGSLWTELERRIFKAEFLKFTNLKIEEKVYYKLSYENGVARTNLTLFIKSYYTWVIKVFGKTIPPQSECFGNFPGTLSLDIVEDFGIMLQALKLCKANNDLLTY